MNRNYLMLLATVAIFIVGCAETTKQGSDTTANTSDSLDVQSPPDSINASNAAEITYSPETTNEMTAEKIRSFLKEKTKKEYSLLSDFEKVFSFYEVDLNSDEKPEYFIRLQGPNFCGSGGCSFYLLNNDFSVNTYFTVTDPPVFRSSILTNGWNDLILFGDFNDDGGVKNYVHLKFDSSKKKYPSNPSVVKKTDMAPGGHDFIMWDENFSRAKEFSF